MATSSARKNPYDEVPYPSDPLPQSHPDHLAAMGTLFGLLPAPAERCRVLEIGCSTGGNLIPMAERHGESAFVGIDYSQVQIAAAQRIAAGLSLPNLELRQADIADLGDELGTFDYIIAHGVFSWIPRELQDRLLALCGRLLNEQGVALVSYNVLPGWQRRSTLRALLWRHAPPGTARGERLARGRALLEFLSTALAQQNTPASALLKQDVDVALRQKDHYLWHEYFEAENDPLYFHQFVERAAPFGLQYLGDAALPTMFPSTFGPLVEQQVRSIAHDVVSAEQHVDLLRDRSFRQTLLCRQGLSLSRQLTPNRLQTLFIAAQLRPRNPHPRFEVVGGRGVRPDGRAVSSPAPPLKAALAALAAAWPRALSIAELEARSGELLGADGASPALTDQQREDLGHNLVQCAASGLVDLSSSPDRFATTISARPRGSRLALLQGSFSPTVTNRRHRTVQLDESTRYLLKYLDGEHDREALVSELMTAVDQGTVSILVDGIPARSGQDVKQALDGSLDRSLAYLAANALLVA